MYLLNCLTPFRKHIAKCTFALFVLSFTSAVPVIAQERCATVQYTKKLRNQNTLLENEQQFENWLRNKMENRKKTLSTQRTKASTYQVPVVVHVIHNGEPVGTGVNIPDAQIQSQIDVLNEDYRRLNADTVNTPAEFQPVAGSMDIEFVLAKRTPEGLPTNGIVRVQGSKSEWQVNDNYELKAQSYWPAEDYLNIWVTDLGNSYLGYAQFPVSGLPGLENSSYNRLTDGVVIDYTAFGTIDAGAFDLDPSYDKGRTATHEIGHFFGLRHIWGDDEDSDVCSGSDYADDTPNQATSTNSCPSGTRTSCGSGDMYQNYLDYTYDACMNLFTKDQVSRMITVIENSPRRASLLTSPALLDPAPVANDLGIKEIISPTPTQCVNAITPTIEIKNYGNNTITSAQIRLLINGVPVETKNFSLSLNPSGVMTVSFADQGPLVSATYTFSFEILQTNSGADGNPADNIRAVNTQIPNSIATPFAETFNSTPSAWTINNPDQLITWQNVTAPNQNPSNKAMYIDFYNYEDSEGEIDILTTPVFDLSAVPSAYLSFDVAYARFPGNADGLRIYVLTDCNSDLFQATKIYEKFGSELETTTSTSAAFTPTSANQWRKEIRILNDFTGNSSVQIAFVGVNDWGNNLYIDNVAVVTDADENLALTEIVSPTPVSCENVVTPELKVRNQSLIQINSFKVEVTLNGQAVQTTAFSQSLGIGEETEVALPEITLLEGMNTLTFEVTEPNGLIDNDPSDNTKSINTYVSNVSDRIPLRENFDDASSGNWTIINPDGGQPWQTISTNYNTSLYFDAFDNTNTGDASWLVSPVLDFSQIQSASLFFDVSYAHQDSRNDQLRILGFTNCGQSYDDLVLDVLVDSLAVTNSSAPWFPQGPEDWKRKYESLESLAGMKDVRIAFVAVNDNGNNLYLDNIEFYLGNNPNPPQVGEPFLIYNTNPGSPGEFTITFNLPERSPVEYEVIDMMGRTLAFAEIPDVVNQTFHVDAGQVATGVYIVRLHIGKDYYARRIFLSGG